MDNLDQLFAAAPFLSFVLLSAIGGLIGTIIFMTGVLLNRAVRSIIYTLEERSMERDRQRRIADARAREALAVQKRRAAKIALELAK